MFLLKKIIAPCLSPLMLCLELLGAGLVLLWFTRRQRTGRVLVTTGTVLLLAFSYSGLPNRLIGLLERRYPSGGMDTPRSGARQPAAPHPELRTGPARRGAPREGGNPEPSSIVILGGGFLPDAALPPNDWVGETYLVRLVEGMRLAKIRPDARLIVSVPGPYEREVKEAWFRDFVAVMGVPATNALLLTGARDTIQELRAVKEAVGAAPFLLVTSASHMPRAMVLARGLGLEAAPAPAGRLVRGTAAWYPYAVFPDPENIERADRAVHEYLGLAWAHLRGQADEGD